MKAPRPAHAFADPLYGAVDRDDPCLVCGQPERKHKVKSLRPRIETRETKARRAKRDKRRPKRHGNRTHQTRKLDRTIIGVDGEGMDTPDGRHIYTYLAAVDEHGVLVSEAYNPLGLSHDECADMILAIPKNTLKFGYMFSYDVTKIIEQMPAADKFYLLRPNARQARECKTCGYKWAGPARGCTECGGLLARGFTRKLTWNKRKYDFFNGSFTITEARPENRQEDGVDNKPANGAGKRDKEDSSKIWDCFRFFGCAFVEAIKDWGVATPDQIDRIKGMKDKRGSFDTEDPEAVKAYCREECHLLALMMRKVITAHDEAEIPLKRYEGAGSTASALLGKNKVGDFKGPNLRELAVLYGAGLALAISCAFFGGRFENSQIGRIDVPVHGYDVSSAYPYSMVDLPCLACGTWKRIKGRTAKLLRVIEKATLALCKFRVGKIPTKIRGEMAWGPLPCRDEKGSICYGANFEGWGWKSEVLPALQWRHVDLAGEAWVYKAGCEDKPFGFVPEAYCQRLRWGKEGAGKALKLGINASYGKTAQTLGDDPPYQSWIWAGNITAHTRGQILEAILLAKDPWSVLAIATDGIYSIEALDLPKPRETGTGHIPNTKGKFAPLGGWEHKEIPEGAFLAKPGLYFRLKAEPDDIRARGVGRKEVYNQQAQLLKAFAEWDRKDMNHHVKMTSRRFYGAKHSVLAQSTCDRCGVSWPGVPERGCPKCLEVGTSFRTHALETPEGKEAYGTWNVRTVEVKFDPYPKRERILRKGGASVRLRMRDLQGAKSAPYKTGIKAAEAEALEAAKDFALDQPDWQESMVAEL